MLILCHVPFFLTSFLRHVILVTRLGLTKNFKQVLTIEIVSAFSDADVGIGALSNKVDAPLCHNSFSIYTFFPNKRCTIFVAI